MSENSLYDRIGGEVGITHLVGAFYQRVLADPELAPFFQHTPMDKLRHMQVDFFTMALGGPPAYSGSPLSHAHQGRGISKDHLRRFIGHLLATLETLNLSRRDVQRIYERLAMEADEVTADQPGGGEAG